MIHGTHNAEPDGNNDVLIYVNGELLHRDEAKISVFDSGYLSEMGFGRRCAFITGS